MLKLKSKAAYEARAEVAKALAHPSRLLVLDALAGGELCVKDLTELVGADQSTVSKHLAILRSAGIVSDRREGACTYYRLRLTCLEGFWSCVEAALRHRLDDQRAAIEV